MPELESKRPRCNVCGAQARGMLHIKLPKGWEAECEHCQNLPGARKVVRHCSLCDEPIVVRGVSGSVRLVCGNCVISKDDLSASEGANKKIRGLKERLNEMHKKNLELIESNNALEKDVERKVRDGIEDREARLQADFEQRERDLTKYIGKLKREREELQNNMADKETTNLTMRLRAKMRAQYGESERQRLEDFGLWLGDRGLTLPEGVPEIEELVEEFCDAGETNEH